MKINNSTEMMFAQAVALSQNGRMKSTVHVGKKIIFILNMDSTILIRFKSNQEFPKSFSFFANDYESNNIEIREGKVAFITKKGNISREKECITPKSNYSEIKKYWLEHKYNSNNSFTLTSNIVQFLEEGLSHVEISKLENEKLSLVQRDIYSGSKVSISLEDDFSEIYDTFIPTFGLRTNDLKALFSFEDSISFKPQTLKNWIYFEGNSGRMAGIISTCIYDELGYIAEEKNEIT